DFSAFDDTGRHLLPDRNKDGCRLLRGEAVIGCSGPPTHIGLVQHGRGDGERVVFPDTLCPPFRRLEEVPAAHEAGHPTLAHEISDDLATRLLGLKDLDDIVRLDDLPALLAE